MKINYYLLSKRVDRALFKTFSSQCTKWLKIMENCQDELELLAGEISLAYDPADNSVRVQCEHEELFKKLNFLAKSFPIALEIGNKNLDAARKMGGARQSMLN